MICISILIPFASPLGNTIKNAVNAQIKNVENIENDALTDTKTYTIIFNWNGATSGSMDQMAVVCGKEIKLPKATFQKDGADFTRWNTKSDGTGFSIYTSLKYKDLTKYTFLGWNTVADGSGITYTDMQEVKNLTDQNNVNIDLYAMWQKINRQK